MKKTLSSLVAALLALILLPAAPVSADGGEAVRIAVIDTGISTRCLDPARVEAGRNLVFPHSGTDDAVGHGTRVAGLILGSEALGLEGIAPNAVLVPLVWYDKYPSGVVKNGGAEAIAGCITAAVDEFDCDIINISAGLPEENELLRAAVEHAENCGALIVSAVGNDNLSMPDSVYYPAGWDCVLGVGAADGEAAAGFSQRSGVDVLAPGVGLTVVSTRADTQTVDGTSYACAIASAVCALWLELEPELSPAQLRGRVLSTARDMLVPGRDADSGYGLIMQPGRHFSDVPADAWYADDVRRMYLSGVMDGTADTLFDPRGTVTRGMLAAMLWRIAGEPEADGDMSFKDVPDDAFYSEAVRWAYGEQILDGYEDELFGPCDDVTREQTAAVLYRYAVWKGCDVSIDASADITGYADAFEVSEWAVTAVQWACGAGILQGDDSGLSPQGGTERAQAAALLDRFIQKTA